MKNNFKKKQLAIKAYKQGLSIRLIASKYKLGFGQVVNLIQPEKRQKTGQKIFKETQI